MIRPGKIFDPPKPSRITGKEQQTIGNAVQALKDEDFPLYCSPKRDGARYVLHKSGGKIRIISDDGKDATDSKALAPLKEFLEGWGASNWILDVEMELWSKEGHWPREACAGEIHLQEPGGKGTIVANCFACYWWEGKDLSDQTYEENWKVLQGLKIPQTPKKSVPSLAKPPLALIWHELCEDREQAEKWIREMSDWPGSEGVVMKRASGQVPFPWAKGRSRSWLKYHKSVVSCVEITKELETKGPAHVYEYGVFPGDLKPDPDSMRNKLTYVGRTFGTSEKFEPGDRALIEAEQVNHYASEAGHRVAFWVPKVLGPCDEAKADTISAVIGRARKAGILVKRVEEEIVLSEKEYNPDKPIRQPFGSPGGKKYLAATIVSLIPPHKVYIEPFVGGGAVWAKKPKSMSELEILNDLNSELMTVYRFFKSAIDEELEAFRKRDWKLRKTQWERLKGSKFRSLADRAHRFLYVRLGSFAKGEASFSPGDRGREIKVAERGESLRARLKGVKLYSQDWLKICEKFDAQDAFIYLDPPYPGDRPGWDAGPEGPILDELAAGLGNLKAKWLLSLNDTSEVREVFSSFDLRAIRIPARAGTDGSPTGVRADRELLIANFSLPKRIVHKELGESSFQKELEDKATDPYMEVPLPERWRRYTVHSHWRGASAHHDPRFQLPDYLIGWTLADQIKGYVKEPVTTLKRAKELDKDPEAWKINWTTGQFKKRRIRGGVVRKTSIYTTEKKKEPSTWIDFEGVVPKGSVGATRNFPGVFSIVDKGQVFFGAQKSWAHEYFLRKGKLQAGKYLIRALGKLGASMGVLKELDLLDLCHDENFEVAYFARQELQQGLDELGVELRIKTVEPQSLTNHLILARIRGEHKESRRWLAERLEEAGFVDWGESVYTPWEREREGQKVLPPAEEVPGRGYTWLTIQAVDQTPYVLSGAVKKNWLPPPGISALPPEIREKVPAEFNYWKKGLTRKQRLERRAELIEAKVLEFEEKHSRCPACGFEVAVVRPNLRCPECGETLKPVQKTHLSQLTESQIHRAFTVLADGLCALGYLDRAERIALSNVIGDTLGAFGEAFRKKMEAGTLSDPDISREDILVLLSEAFRGGLKAAGSSGGPGTTLRDRAREARALISAMSKFVKGDRAAISVWKDSKGVRRYTALCSAELEDLEYETVTEQAMDYSIELCQRHEFKPFLTIGHVPWSRVGRSLWEIRLGPFWVEGGRFFSGWLADQAFTAIREDVKGKIKISIGFLYPVASFEKRKYGKLFRYESTLTRSPALPITAIGVTEGGFEDASQ